MLWIETAREDHIEGIYHAYDAVTRERQYFATINAGPLAGFMQWMNEAFNRGSPCHVVLLEEQVIGWSMAHRTGEEFRQHCGTLFVGILPEYRGLGIGRELLRTTLETAWDKGMTRVDLQVYADNTNAIRLYRQLGFVEEGLHCHAHLVDGRLRDVLTMAVVKLPQAASTANAENAHACGDIIVGIS
jgi:ribosomal protein S18 acetylase RimI-like enzyme